MVLTESEKLECFENFSYEMSCWIEYKPETLARLKKFYKSMVSIVLGGEGLQKRWHNARNNGMEYKELKKLYWDYETNYPIKEDSEQ